MLLLPFKITSLLRTGDSCINIFKRLFSGGKGGGGGEGDDENSSTPTVLTKDAVVAFETALNFLPARRYRDKLR